MEYQQRQRLVDSAEPEDIRQKLLEYGWEQKRLYSGDFMFLTCDYKKVGLTRKTIGDLLSSIGTKTNPAYPNRRAKTFGQHLEEMLEYYDIKTIILEGSWRTVSPSHTIVSSRGVEYYTWDMVWDFLHTWQDRGFTLELTANQGHTIQRLNRLYAYYSKPYHTGAVSHSVVGDDRALAFPVGCRGKTGLKVLESLGSLQEVGNSTIQDLLNIDDIGPKRAEAIAVHFRKDTRHDNSN